MINQLQPTHAVQYAIYKLDKISFGLVIRKTYPNIETMYMRDENPSKILIEITDHISSRPG